jgi:ABC-type phosphate transport system substrate-binding protein
MKLKQVFGRARRCALLLAGSLAISGVALAGDYVVIVNKANGGTVDKATVAKVYTGELRNWSDGTPVLAVDLPEDSPLRASFSTEVVGKTVSNLKALWAQLIFSGKALPPKQAPSDDEVKKLVSSTKGGVGYVKAASADDTVRVAFK